MSRAALTRAAVVLSSFLIAGALALPAPALGQSTDFVPTDATDGAGRAFLNRDDPTAPGYLFSVFTFDTPERAEAAEAEIRAQTPSTGEPVTGGDIDGTPIVGTTTEDDAAARLDGLVDSASAYVFDVTSGDFVSSSAYLLIRDGSSLFIWAEVVQSDVTSGAATPAAVSPDELVTLAVGWFQTDRTGGELIDRLPTIDRVPAGYTETLTARTLAELNGGGSLATPAT